MKEIENYSGYFVTEDGQVYSKKRKQPKFLKQQLDKDGYLRVSLSNNSKPKCFGVHRLVAFAFLGAPDDPDMEVNHRSGVKSDNRVVNLEWVTAKQNMRHSIEVLGNVFGHIGETNGGVKIKEEDVIKIRELYAGREYTQENLAVMFDLSRSHISSIVNRRFWTHI